MRVVLTRSLLVVLLVLLAAEGATRAVADRLPSPMRWSSAEEQVKADDLGGPDRRVEAGGTVFLGSSMMDAAADPRRFLGSGTGAGTAYNAALLGADTRIMRVWWQALVGPQVRPGTVVIGVSCREITEEAAQDAQLDQFLGSRAVRDHLGELGVLDRADAAAGRVSSLVLHRQELREPLNLTGRDRRDGDTFVIGDLGQDEHFLDRSYPPPDRVREVLYDPDVPELLVAPDKVAALEGLVGDARDSGAEVWVVNMPIAQDFVGYLPEPSAQTYEYCTGLLREASEGAGARFSDAGIWSQELFADPIHLNRAGSERFTDWMAEQVAAGEVLAPPED